MVKNIDHRDKIILALQKQKAALMKRISLQPNFLRASYVRQYLTCGKTNCRCRRGFKHGPFYYLVQCLGTGNVRKFLLKTREQRKQARDGIAAHLKLQRQLAELSEINTELLRHSGDFDCKNGKQKKLLFRSKTTPVRIGQNPTKAL
jgi:hypothetical protein